MISSKRVTGPWSKVKTGRLHGDLDLEFQLKTAGLMSRRLSMCPLRVYADGFKSLDIKNSDVRLLIDCRPFQSSLTGVHGHIEICVRLPSSPPQTFILAQEFQRFLGKFGSSKGNAYIGSRRGI